MSQRKMHASDTGSLLEASMYCIMCCVQCVRFGIGLIITSPITYLNVSCFCQFQAYSTVRCMLLAPSIDEEARVKTDYFGMSQSGQPATTVSLRPHPIVLTLRGLKPSHF